MQYLSIVALLAASLSGAQAAWSGGKAACFTAKVKAPSQWSDNNAGRGETINALKQFCKEVNKDFGPMKIEPTTATKQKYCKEVRGQRIDFNVRNIAHTPAKLDEIWCSDRFAELVKNCDAGGNFMIDNWYFYTAPAGGKC